MLDLLRQSQSAQEVAEIVGERMELEPDLVVPEAMAGKPRPVDRILTVLNSLLGCAALIIETRDPLSRSRQIGDA